MQEAESTLWPTIALCTYITLNPVPSLIAEQPLPTILSSLHPTAVLPAIHRQKKDLDVTYY